MSKKIIIIIAIIILVVIIGAGIIGYLAYQNIENNKTTGTDWGDIYYNYLEDAKQTKEGKLINYGLYDNVENATIQFCQIKDEDTPSMVIKYTKSGNKYITIWDINEEKNKPDVEFKPEKEELKLLYNIEKQEYEWYCYQNEEGHELYTEIMPTEDTTNEGQIIYKIYDFKETDLPKDEELEETEKLTISKFEETFIIPDFEESKEISIDLDASKRKLKEAVTESVKEYKSEDEILTENVKETVENKLTELTNKKEKIKKVEEDKKKQEEEEARLKAEEENKKKAEETTNKEIEGLKVGSYTLKYGTYKGKDYEYTDNADGAVDVLITLKSDETYTVTRTYKATGRSTNSKGTFKAGKLNGVNTLELSNDGVYTATANNIFETMAGSSSKFTYQGN